MSAWRKGAAAMPGRPTMLRGQMPRLSSRAMELGRRASKQKTAHMAAGHASANMRRGLRRSQRVEAWAGRDTE